MDFDPHRNGIINVDLYDYLMSINAATFMDVADSVSKVHLVHYSEAVDHISISTIVLPY